MLSHSVTGVSLWHETFSRPYEWRRFACVTKMSYAMNGSNMGLNQIGENFGMMSVTGMRAIGNMIPGLDKILHGMRTTTLSHAELKKTQDCR